MRNQVSLPFWLVIILIVLFFINLGMLFQIPPPPPDLRRWLGLLLLGLLGWWMYQSWIARPKPAPPPPAPAPAIPTTGITYEGIVHNYHYNDLGDMDGVYVQTNEGQELLFHFPPHLAKKVSDIAPTGKAITIIAHARGPAAHLDIQQLTAADGSTLSLSPPQPPPPPSGENITVRIDTLVFQLNERGEKIGLVQKPYLIALRPDVIENLSSAFEAKPLDIIVTGIARDEGYFVNKYHYIVVHPLTITIDHQTFLLQ